MKRHLGYKNLDPKDKAFWKNLFTSPFVVFLEQDPGRIPSGYFYGHTQTTTAGLMNLASGHGNACILQKIEAKVKTVTMRRYSDIVTAFYFPLIAGLRSVSLKMSGNIIGEWTPEGSEFRQPPLPLPVVLDECRSLPASCTETPWKRILEGCRSRADYPIIHHDFGRTIEINGESYRRAVLVHPCISLIALIYQPMTLSFELEEEQEFAFYQESWLLGNESRMHVAQKPTKYALHSDTLTDHSNDGRIHGGMLQVNYENPPVLSDLGRLLQNEIDTQHAMGGVKALRDSAFKK